MGLKATVRIKNSEDFKVGDLVIPIPSPSAALFETYSNEIGLVVDVDPYAPWALEVLINGKVVGMSSYTVKLLSPGEVPTPLEKHEAQTW
jgi:hypothetical protein